MFFNQANTCLVDKKNFPLCLEVFDLVCPKEEREGTTLLFVTNTQGASHSASSNRDSPDFCYHEFDTYTHKFLPYREKAHCTIADFSHNISQEIRIKTKASRRCEKGYIFFEASKLAELESELGGLVPDQAEKILSTFFQEILDRSPPFQASPAELRGWNSLQALQNPLRLKRKTISEQGSPCSECSSFRPRVDGTTHLGPRIDEAVHLGRWSCSDCTGDRNA